MEYGFREAEEKLEREGLVAGTCVCMCFVSLPLNLYRTVLIRRNCSCGMTL